MKQLRNRVFLMLSILFFSINCCKGQSNSVEIDKSWPFSEYFEVTKKHDRESNTWYYLTRIKHADKEGNIIRLKTEFANKTEGEPVRAFALRKNTAVAINASMGLLTLPPDTRQPVGIQIIDGKIIQQLKTTSYTLGIKDNNELVSYPPGTKAEEILKDGVNNALTAFNPLIEDHKMVSEEVLNVRRNSFVKHPRQVIGQFDNLDILILSCGGRGFDGDGMTARDMMRILKGMNVKFAFNLDGGGSVSTVIKDQLITKKIDNDGSAERLRSNFLYVMEKND